MGAVCVRIFVVFICCLLGYIDSYPIEKQIDHSNDESAPNPAFARWTELLAFAFTVTCVLLVIGCLNCCRQRAGFKEFTNSVSETNENSVRLDFVNPLQNVASPQPSSTYSIFSSIAQATNAADRQPDSIVTFEPLPKVLPNKYSNLRSSKQLLFGNANDISLVGDWLADRDFPRQQLHYLRECGQGWFGKVVEGEARGIQPSMNKVHRVVVRILKEDASTAEQAFFLQEAKPFRDLSHPNVLKLLGKCLENVPFLLMFETCSNGDLKGFLKQNVGNREALIYQGIVLRMSVDIASGLSFMLQNGFVHTDIAARNCLVTGDLRIKVGDYGTGLYAYEEEYYFNGDIALPIRWCAPETLNCTETTIEPKQVTGASCIWSFGVLLWELEEWGELPYRDLTDEQVIHKVFGAEELRLPPPTNKTPYSQEIYNTMSECWKDYIDRPSFIHVMNSLSALLHRFKSNNFDARWYSSKPNSVSTADNEEDKLRPHSAISKCDTDSGIDLDNPRLRRSDFSMLQQSGSLRRVDDFSSESPASSRRFSNSSAGDLFSSPYSMKLRSPSLENLHGSLSSLNRRVINCGDVDEMFEATRSSDRKVDFRLGLVSSGDPSSILWNNKPLFQSDSYLEENSILKRVGGMDSMSTDAEEEIWRRRIERGEFTEKVKEKSKSVADLMVLTHIDCSESSESDSLPSFHSRQSSFNNRHQCRRLSSKYSNTGAPMSLLNSLSFGSESNLPVVEKDQEFQDTLKKIQIAKISGNEDSLNFVSLQANSLVLSNREDSNNKDGKIGHFLANEASEKRTLSSHINYTFSHSVAGSKSTTKLPLLLFDSNVVPKSGEEEGKVLSSEDESKQEVVSDVESSITGASPSSTNDEFAYMSSCSSDNVDSVVIGPSESHTLEFFKGLKTTLIESRTEEEERETSTEPFASTDEFHQFVEENPQTLNEFLNDAGEDYFSYKCASEKMPDTREMPRSSYCDFCYASSECLRTDENCCSCESFENLEKLRDCTALNSCPFQSDDSGRGTDQINSGDGSSDKSLEGSISVQMNEVKNRLEDVIAKFTVADDASDDNCSSLEEDKEEYDAVEKRLKGVREEIVIEELTADELNGVEEVEGTESLFIEIEEPEEHSASADEDTCLDTVVDSSNSNKSAEECREKGNECSDMSPASFKQEESSFFIKTEIDKEIVAELSKSCDSISPNDLTYDLNENVDVSDGAASLESEASTSKPFLNQVNTEDPITDENAVVYEISDILEVLAEPYSLSYSVNEEDVDAQSCLDPDDDDVDYNEDRIPSNWLPVSIDDDDECKRSLEVDECFVEAIRNELLEKLPNSSTLAFGEPELVEPLVIEVDDEKSIANEENNPTNIVIEYNAYQAQLSPILEEEDEDAYSSFSSVQSIASSSCSNSSASETINASTSCTFEGDDILVVNTETNEASFRSSIDLPVRTVGRKHQLNETYEIDENDDTIGISDPLDSDSVPTPDSLSPGTSSKTGAHLSYSSSDCGNLSDVFLSPSSSKNFDEFDMDRSPDDARLLNTPENMSQTNYQQTMCNIDEMLKRDSTAQLSGPLQLDESPDLQNPPPWLRSFFKPANEVASLMNFDSSRDEEAEFRSLPADFKTECWPTLEELAPSQINEPVIARTETKELQRAEVAEKVYVSENEASSSDNSQSVSLKSPPTKEPPSTISHSAKTKNSIALYGNGPQKIRNFYVSLVEDDSLLNNSAKTKRVESSYWSERFAVSSSEDSKKTWRSPTFGSSYLGSPTFDMGASSAQEKEVEANANANDMLMSTSFIESDSQDGSVDGRDDTQMRSDDSDEDGVESTSEEFVWKENTGTDIAQNNKTNFDEEDDDEEDDDDEELADFVPFSWNCEAIPERSSLKTKERISANKKNVSFKKQKYHCVYEYPKEEPNYARIYDNMLQERMLSLWNVDRDYMYNDYSSFSDWELDDCGDDQQIQTNDDLVPFTTGAVSTPAKSNSIPNKLGFYTIGAYDLDTTKSDDSPPGCLSSNNTETSSPVSSCSGISPANSLSPIAKYFTTDILQDKSNWSPDTDSSNTSSSAAEQDAIQNVVENGSPVETSSTLALGELKHTKNRLKLDLNNTITSYKSSTTAEQSKLVKKYDSDNDAIKVSPLTSDRTDDENDEDDFVNDYSALNYKSCDISPVVELQSLTSTSVA